MTTITSSMIEYESFTAAVVTVAGQRYRVEVEDDLDSTPLDADCYDEEDIEAWREDRWEFVTVVVTPLSVYDRDQFELSDSLSGLEFGSYAWNRGNAHEGAITAYRVKQAEHLGGYPCAVS